MAALSAVISNTSPLELTVTADPALAAKRTIELDVTLLGDTVHTTAMFPIKVTDTERTWTLKSETADGTTAIFTATA